MQIFKLDHLCKAFSSSRKFCLFEFSYREPFNLAHFSIHFLQKAGKKLLEVTVLITYSRSLFRIVLLSLVSLGFLTAFTSCKKKDPKTYEYEVNNEVILPSNVSKTRLKSSDQYISILYTNLYQKALSSNNLATISQCFESIGDQGLARQIFLSNLMKKGGVIMPTAAQMTADLDKFVTDTYVRFYVRYPSESEKTYMKQLITADPNITPELVYTSFALSDEYMFY
jgi:hypothetical protein